VTVPAERTARDVQRVWADGVLTAAGALLAGVSAHLAAKVTEDLLLRGRPDGVLSDVLSRGAGAHLPLDVAGVAGLGPAIAGGVRLLLGGPA
jgi:undecaprenyl-diphosphatase